jgi:hypothetical protein
MVKTIASFTVAGLIGLILFCIITGGFRDVLNDRLIIDTDYPNAAAAFQLYVTDQWRFPIGENPKFGETNIFFSDASPIYAVTAKAIYSLTGVSLSFNYLIIISFSLFALFSLRLARRVSDDPPTQWLIAVLLILNLVMPTRMIGAQHIALGSYWVLLWAMTCVQSNQTSSKMRYCEPVLCTSVAILSHSYLGAMAIATVMVQLIWKKRYTLALSSVLMPVALLTVCGFFEEPHALCHGTKAYGLNLAAFFYSLNWAFTGNWYKPENIAQYDIFLFIGSGVMLILASNVIARIIEIFTYGTLSSGGDRQTQSSLYPLIAAAFLLALYGMAFDINVGGWHLASFEIPHPLEFLYQRFRVAGRFGTILCYLMIVLTVLWWGKRRRNRLWWIVSVAAILLQVADAFHSSRYASHKNNLAIEERDIQSNAVSHLLAHAKWTGHVIKKVDFPDLESQRLLDYLIVRAGATKFSAVYSARANPRNLTERMERSVFSKGDLLITTEGRYDPSICDKTAVAKGFYLCLVR